MNDEFVKRILALRGTTEGQQWLNSIPTTIQQYEKKWNLKAQSPFHLTYNYVAPAIRSSGEHVVLKIGFPKDKEFATEANALEIFQADAAIKLLEFDADNAVMLLEKAEPGTAVHTLPNDSKQLSIVASVIKKLHKPIQSTTRFPTLSNWAQAFTRYKKAFPKHISPIPSALFDTAEQIFTEYLQDATEFVLLHGDLHNDNILLSQRGWVAIDPKGVVGQPEYEAGTFLRNPYHDLAGHTNIKAFETRRIIQLSEKLGFDKKRVKNWAFAQTILSMIWFLEDEKKVNELYIRNAKLLNEITF